MHLKLSSAKCFFLSWGRWVLSVQLWVPIVSPLHVLCHDDVIRWKHFPRYWPFVRKIHRSSVNSPHKGQCRRALMFSLICARINGWITNRETGDLRGHQAHCDVIVMITIPMDPSLDHLSTATNIVPQVLWLNMRVAQFHTMAHGKHALSSI